MFIVLGDTHANFRYIMTTIKNRDIRDTTILHVGDFGIGFASQESDRDKLSKLSNLLEKHNCHMYVIRGNHDNPAYFNGQWDWTNLHLVEDYTVINVNGDDVLMVGGAISVDRYGRKKDRLKLASQGIDQESYWYGEAFVLDEEKLKEIKGVRYVVTHTAPHFCFPINSNDMSVNSYGGFVESFVLDDPTLKSELFEERSNLTKMYEILKENNLIEKWFYGHFHDSMNLDYDYTNFVLLNVNEFKEIRQGGEYNIETDINID